MSMLVISPHFDDGVLSCGQILAEQPHATLLTVFTGLPVGEKLLTSYDANCGFGTSMDAMTVRADENQHACTVLHTKAVGWEFRDCQYGVQLDRKKLTRRLAAQGAQFEHVLAPLGIMHPDHQIVGADCREAFKGHRGLYLYEELPYRVQFPENVAASLEQLRQDGWTLDLADPFPRGPLEIKMAAVECYRSQLSPEMRRWVQVPERLWRLTR